MSNSESGLPIRDCSWQDLLAKPPKQTLWGIAPTGRIHLGYLPYLQLLTRLTNGGSRPIVLIANYHGYLDAEKTGWSEIDRRTSEYRKIINKVDLPVRETNSFYVLPAYVEQLFKISTVLSVEDVMAAGEGTLVTTRSERRVSDVLYVVTQVLDVLYLGVDAVICGEDEAPIYRFGLPLLEKALGVVCRGCWLAMCPGIVRPEMHSSDSLENKIHLDDSPERIQHQFICHRERYAHSRSADVPLVRYVEDVLLPIAGITTSISSSDEGRFKSAMDATVELLRTWRA